MVAGWDFAETKALLDILDQGEMLTCETNSTG